ncbi:peptidoglycan O-acetyltransferase [Oxobacter pfennigii]|uniref:Teichoic acid D-alanyltransferase n=1 Tax=Oxobacter pfennigii TaxID=36849 RepID=A0A0P8YSZ0_9CLOT|nr:D-alanyl-lipoteichoic acid biosynthesis protein DltB [Oxobacter pfennigii]KPU42798.1 peptidoglycan O-acetyltransferase [Oxobacter pfennigii]
MIPYSGLYFFYILSIAFIPLILLGLKGKPIKKYGMIMNLFMLLLLFGGSKIQTVCLVLFYSGQLVLIRGYIYLRRKYESIWLMRILVALSILPLVLVKASPYFTSWTIGFLGISYVTFKSVQMIIEIHDGLIKEFSIWDFTYFLLFFPSISSGPIDRSRRFMEDINKTFTKDEYKRYLDEGIRKIFYGAAYKFIFSALISTYWMAKIPEAKSILNTINYMYAYSLYLFFDFAGYSLLAVGTSHILGVNTPENFDKPFISKDIKDFWNRWHISLSFWFRDFIYTRFVMRALKKKWFKSRYTASYIGYIITMGVMGIWHGTEIHYILYGLYHALLIISTDFFQRKSSWYKKNKNNEGFNYLSTAVTFNLVCFGFLIFSGYLF